jgi:hypothetical protein
MALLPQLIAAGQIRQYKRRKWFWAGGGAAFGLGFVLMIPAVLLLPPLWAGIALVAALGWGSIGRGVASVAYKDVLAKTVPQGRRGTLLATRATAGGILTLAAGALLRLFVADSSSLTPFVVLLAAAAALWFVGTALAAAVDEQPGATEGARDFMEQLRAGWYLLEEKPGFRRFVLARLLLLSVKLAVPFYVLYARQLTGDNIGGLSLYVMATGLAAVLSSLFWGRFSDRSSRTVMILGSGLSIAIGIIALLVTLLPSSWQTPLLFAVVFFVIGVAKAGVRLGRKTYLVDGAPGDARPLYVSVSNTLVGTVTLASGALGIVADLVSVPALLVLFLVLTALGSFVAWRLPEAAHMAD